MTLIVIRRDTTAAWASANPVLAAGEFGLDTTLGKIKVGDGTTAWASLPFQGGGSRSVVSVTSSVTLGAASGTDYVVLIGASGAPTLPTAVGNTNRYTLKNVHTTNKTVATTSSQTIDGSTTVSLTPNTSLDVVSDNTNWNVV